MLGKVEGSERSRPTIVFSGCSIFQELHDKGEEHCFTFGVAKMIPRSLHEIDGSLKRFGIKILARSRYSPPGPQAADTSASWRAMLSCLCLGLASYMMPERGHT